ncbi:MAG: hypothetical protein ACOYNR_10285 [Blastocatellia bacterium]
MRQGANCPLPPGHWIWAVPALSAEGQIRALAVYLTGWQPGGGMAAAETAARTAKGGDDQCRGPGDC